MYNSRSISYTPKATKTYTIDEKVFLWFIFNKSVTEIDPMAKAKTSVRVVMVTETPACFRPCPMASEIGISAAEL